MNTNQLPCAFIKNYFSKKISFFHVCMCLFTGFLFYYFDVIFCLLTNATLSWLLKFYEFWNQVILVFHLWSYFSKLLALHSIGNLVLLCQLLQRTWGDFHCDCIHSKINFRSLLIHLFSSSKISINNICGFKCILFYIFCHI